MKPHLQIYITDKVNFLCKSNGSASGTTPSYEKVFPCHFSFTNSSADFKLYCIYVFHHPMMKRRQYSIGGWCCGKYSLHIIWNIWGICPAAPPVWIYVTLERFLWFILLRPLHTKQIEDNEQKLRPTVSSCPFFWRTSTEHTVKHTGRTTAKQSEIWKGIPCGGR